MTMNKLIKRHIYGGSLWFLAVSALTACAEVQFANPVMPGFYSDPSVCRANGKYCLATSSMQLFPAIPLFESEDLIHWTLKGHAVERSGIAPLGSDRPDREFCGYFAPTLRFHAGRFYLVVDNHSDREGSNRSVGPVIMYADRLEGPWTAPREIENIGMSLGDPSLDFIDGKCYFTGTNGREIFLAEMDAAAGRVLERPRAVWKGAGGIWPEGPHVFKRGDWYYVMIAEGGTEYGHSETIARSKDIYGPYEGCPRNPIAGHARWAAQGSPLQAVGHGDFVYDESGAGHFICHAMRPQFGKHHLLGRETVAVPLSWTDDGWPLVNGGKPIAYVENTENLPAWDWTYVRNPVLSNYRLVRPDGTISLKPTPVRLSDAGSPSFVGTRQTKINQTFRGMLVTRPQTGVEVGVVAYMGRSHHYALAVAERVGGECVAFVRYRLGIMSFASEPVKIGSFPVELAIESKAKEIRLTAGGRLVATADPRHISSETDSDSPYSGVIYGFFAEGPSDRAEAVFRPQPLH